jgi:uncharacterized protein (TIGR02594 family)
MKKGKTGQAALIAAALLGTTFLVPPTEAQARRYDGASTQSSYEQRPTVRKKVAKKKQATVTRKAKKGRHHANNRRYSRQHTVRSRAAARNRAAANTRPAAQNPQIQSAQINDMYDMTQIHRAPIEPYAHVRTVPTAAARTSNSSSWSGGWYRTNHMSKAASMVGMHARANRSDLKKIFAASLNKPVDPVRTPWCAAWANAVLQSSGIKGTNSLLARSFLGWGASTSSPREGDVVVMTRGRSSISGHVGFFVEKQIINGRSYVKVLGGNQGKQVSKAWYPESRVIGYRRAG